MEWISFFTGVTISGLALALFSSNNEEVTEEFDNIEQEESEIPVNDFKNRHVTLSCQTCRKLKRHKEVEPNLFQCVKCKRHVDLRAS